MGKSNLKEGSPIVPDSSLPWDSLTEEFAPAPDRLQVISSTTAINSRGSDELKQRVVQRRRLAIRWVVAAVILLGIFFTRNIPFDSQSGQSGSAWASTEGYVVNVEMVILGAETEYKLRREEARSALDAVVETWATKHNIATNGTNITPSARIRSIGGGGGFQFHFKSFQIDLLGVNEVAKDELVHSLACLPGVAPPEVARHTMYFSLGGLTEAMIGRKVIIDGTKYSFPQDFNWDEAQFLRHVFGGDPDYRRIQFVAFFGKISDPIGGGVRGIFEVGDIVRVGFTPQGELEYTTVVDVWEEGRVLQERIDDNTRQWWSKSLPDRVNEADFDYKAALYKSRERLNIPLDPNEIRGHDFKLRLSLEYQLFPPDRLRAPVAEKFSQAELARNVELYKQASELLDAWCADHPEYNYRLKRNHNLHLGPLKFGELPLFIYVGWLDDDEKLVVELGELFARVEGMPEPHIELVELYPEN